MSRRAFRGAVENPRPRAALVMAALATLTLAMTQQIDPLPLAVATAALVAAARFRERPRAWQRSRWLLNGALAAAVAVAVAKWARGELAILALAHFALLAQGLQLLDARPRRSEFVLVALALFQVILAANLTDSVLFPLLLVAFTVATVWTLLVHTLRAEALEAGEPEAARRALTGGLRRTITLASLLSVALAVVLFPALPRIRSGALLSRGLGSAVAVSGFSEQVTLGDLGRIRLDPQVVLRVETLEGEAPDTAQRYVRALAFDHFDGRTWSITPPGRSRIPGHAEFGVVLGPEEPGQRLVERIAREGIPSGVLFATGTPVAIRGALGRLERDVNGALYAHKTEGFRVDYTVTSRVARPPESDLAGARAALPEPRGARYVALPEFPAAVEELAREIASGARSDGERAGAIERFLRDRGRYSDTPPTLDPGDPRSPIEVFLEGGMAGHCEYFASAMAVLARRMGIPARIVNGFAGGKENPIGGFVEFAQADAHTWVEIHYADVGWVRYDPTPPDLRMAGARALRGSSRLGDLASALELWWFRNVVDFDRGRQLAALRGLWRRWHAWRQRAPAPRVGIQRPGRPDSAWSLPRPPHWAWPVAAIGLALAAGASAARRRKLREAVPPFYADALRLLARSGRRRGATTTARAFADEAAEGLPPAAASAFRALTEAYLRERFGGQPAARPERALAALRDSLRA